MMRLALVVCLFFCGALAHAQPFSVKQKLFDFSRQEDLGLKPATGTETALVYAAQVNYSQYNHGVVLFAFGGKLYAQWQSSIQDEDAEDTRILYSMSEDGVNWSKATELVAARSKAKVSNGGWWQNGKEFIAFINVWPNDLSPRGGYVEAIKSTDGMHWSPPQPLLFFDGRKVNGVIEQDLHTLPGGRILTALHVQPGLRAKPFYTDDTSGLAGWKIAEFNNLPAKPEVSRELEPSSFVQSSGDVVMVFRDQNSSFRILAAVSKNKGESWSQAEVTNMPDSRAKQSAGNLPDGTAFLVNNPSGSKAREPLVITLSRDGKTFDRAFLLRAGGAKLHDPKYAGRYKRRGFSYPKSFLWKDYLYAAYAQNKEDIMVTRVPVKALMDISR